MAEASVLHRLGRVPAESLPEIAAHVAALPEPVREVLVQCAPYPDAFLPEEVGLPLATLMRAWQVCVLDSVEGDDGQRRLVVPPCVRAACPLDPGHPASRAFAAAVVAKALPPAMAMLGVFDEDARATVIRERARVDAVLALGTPDESTHTGSRKPVSLASDRTSTMGGHPLLSELPRGPCRRSTR